MKAINLFFLAFLLISMEAKATQVPNIYKKEEDKFTYIWAEFEDKKTDKLITGFINSLKEKYNVYSLERSHLPINDDAFVKPNATVGMNQSFIILATLSPKYDKDVISFIQENINKLPTPYLYELARRLHKVDKPNAYNWVFMAKYMGIYDAYRCSDKTSKQGIAYWTGYNESLHKEIVSIGESKLEKKFRSFGLKKIDELNWTKPAYWICFHGIEASSGKLNSDNYVIPKEEWGNIKHMIKSYIEEKLQ